MLCQENLMKLKQSIWIAVVIYFKRNKLLFFHNDWFEVGCKVGVLGRHSYLTFSFKPSKNHILSLYKNSSSTFPLNLNKNS